MINTLSIVYTVGLTTFRAHVCPITGQLRVTTPGRTTYCSIDSEGYRKGKELWDAAGAALEPKAKAKAKRRRAKA